MESQNDVISELRPLHSGKSEPLRVIRLVTRLTVPEQRECQRLVKFTLRGDCEDFSSKYGAITLCRIEEFQSHGSYRLLMQSLRFRLTHCGTKIEGVAIYLLYIPAHDKIMKALYVI